MGVSVIIAAIVFGLAHLPGTAAIMAIPPNCLENSPY
jgi:membrane protease YdiL (CAAX protease family)